MWFMYIINKLADEPESERIIEVNGFTSGSYEKGVFCFICDGKRVSFGTKPQNETYNYIHHLEMDEIRELHNAYPDQIPPAFDTKIDKNGLNVWGETVEKGLCELMLMEQLYLDGRNSKGEVERSKLKWANSEKWKRIVKKR
jgi:hypothetical protein